MMRSGTPSWGYLGCALLLGCGASAGAPRSAAPAETPGTVATAADFSPPAVASGYTRIVAPVIEAVPPGGDSIRCQYVMAPFDRDMDVLDVQGYQSKGGHHSIAYAVNNAAALGTSRECNVEDNTSIGGFLGGVGGEGGGKARLPEGVVFRLTKGSTIMLNTHFLNVSDSAVDGQTVLDVRFEEVDPSRKVASIFVNLTTDFTVTALAKTSADAQCVVPHDMHFLSFTNHMHSYGARSETVLTGPGDSAGRSVHVDPSWTEDMQFNPAFTNWTLDATFDVKQGEVLSTHCEWENTTAKSVVFPDEMCVGFGFFLTDASSSPICLGGQWSE